MASGMPASPLFSSLSKHVDWAYKQQPKFLSLQRGLEMQCPCPRHLCGYQQNMLLHFRHMQRVRPKRNLGDGSVVGSTVTIA